MRFRPLEFFVQAFIDDEWTDLNEEPIATLDRGRVFLRRTLIETQKDMRMKIVERHYLPKGEFDVPHYDVTKVEL